MTDGHGFLKGQPIPGAKCACYQCTEEFCLENPLPPEEGLDYRMHRMFLCAKCGNKRCPHATDHRHMCTGSNAAGQRGSRYA